MPSTTESTVRPIRFYHAKAARPICLYDGVTNEGEPMFLGKWEGLAVIAKNSNNFFLVPEAQINDYLNVQKTARGLMLRARSGPVITPTGEKFQWVVEAGRSCPDGCDDTINFREVVESKERALALIAQMDGTSYRGRLEFLRIRGPAFYQITRPTRRATASQQTPRVTASQQGSRPVPVAATASTIATTRVGERPGMDAFINSVLPQIQRREAGVPAMRIRASMPRTSAVFSAPTWDTVPPMTDGINEEIDRQVMEQVNTGIDSLHPANSFSNYLNSLIGSRTTSEAQRRMVQELARLIAQDPRASHTNPTPETSDNPPTATPSNE